MADIFEPMNQPTGSTAFTIRIQQLESELRAAREQLSEYRNLLRCPKGHISKREPTEPCPVCAAREEIERLKRVIECDRSKIANGVTKLRRELNSRHWLTEGRGSYEWNDDRFHAEFLAAGQALIKAMEPLVKLAADLSDSPQTTTQVVEARRNLEEERDAALQREKKLLEALREIVDICRDSGYGPAFIALRTALATLAESEAEKGGGAE